MARRAAPAIETEKPARAPKAPKPTAEKPAAEKAPREPKAPKASATEKARVDTGKGVLASGEPRLRGEGFGGRNMLARQIDKVLRQYAAGKLKVEGPLTVSKIATAVGAANENTPSTGAVSAALARWASEGYVRVTAKPTAFKEFTAKYKDSTFDTFLADRATARAKDRAKAKAAAEKS